MPTGIKPKNIPLKDSKDPAKRRRAENNRQSYKRWRQRNGFKTSNVQKATRKYTRANETGVHLKIKNAGLNIAQAKRECRKEINKAKTKYKKFTDQFKDIVTLEKLMREVTKGR